MSHTIQDAVRDLLAIVERLARAYPKKRFTLDGRLVGDIGEVLVEDAYDLELFEDVKKHHDGQTPDGRLVQIKATMKESLTSPADHVPNYYLGIRILSDGSFVPIFNGPGVVAGEAVKNRAAPKTNLHVVSIPTLERLQNNVLEKDKIPERKPNCPMKSR